MNLETMMLMIPVGAANAVSRETLQYRWRMADRSVRDTIHKLRELHNTESSGVIAEYAILSNSSGDKADRGYWRSNDPEEIARYNREVESRAKQVMRSWQRLPR